MARRRSLFFKQTPTLPGFGLSFGVSTLYLALIIPVSYTHLTLPTKA